MIIRRVLWKQMEEVVNPAFKVWDALWGRQYLNWAVQMIQISAVRSVPLKETSW